MLNLQDKTRHGVIGAFNLLIGGASTLAAYALSENLIDFSKPDRNSLSIASNSLTAALSQDDPNTSLVSAKESIDAALQNPTPALTQNENAILYLTDAQLSLTELLARNSYTLADKENIALAKSQVDSVLPNYEFKQGYDLGLSLGVLSTIGIVLLGKAVKRFYLANRSSREEYRSNMNRVSSFRNH